MPRCAYGSVFVCVCVSVCVCRLLQLLKYQWSASKSFYRLLVWILIRGFAKQCFVLELLPIVLLTWNAIAAFSEEHVAKLVYWVLLLYLVVSSALECYIAIGSCKSELQRLYSLAQPSPDVFYLNARSITWVWWTSYNYVEVVSTRRRFLGVLTAAVNWRQKEGKKVMQSSLLLPNLLQFSS